MDKSKIEKEKENLKQLREELKSKKPDLFYSEIPEERKKELIDHLTKKRKLFTEAEMKKKTYEELDEQYRRLYSNFDDDYEIYENKRVKALEQQNEIEVMSKYLVDRDRLDPKKPEKNLQLITVWSEIADNFDMEDLERIRKFHE